LEIRTFSGGIALDVPADAIENLGSFVFCNCISNDTCASLFDSLDHRRVDVTASDISELDFGKDRWSLFVCFADFLLDSRDKPFPTREDGLSVFPDNFFLQLKEARWKSFSLITRK